MNRREEILSINKQWAIDVLIKMLAYVYKIECFEHTVFEELERLEELYLDEKNLTIKRGEKENGSN